MTLASRSKPMPVSTQGLFNSSNPPSLFVRAYCMNTKFQISRNLSPSIASPWSQKISLQGPQGVPGSNPIDQKLSNSVIRRICPVSSRKPVSLLQSNAEESSECNTVILSLSGGNPNTFVRYSQASTIDSS